MEKTQVFLREEQREALREIAARTGQRQSALIRHGVDLVIAEIQFKTAEWRVALDGVKGIWADREDLLFETLFSTLGLIPVSVAISRQASDYLRRYTKSHNPDPFDAIIAAFAAVQGLDLVTLNLKHFPMMAELERPY